MYAHFSLQQKNNNIAAFPDAKKISASFVYRVIFANFCLKLITILSCLQYSYRMANVYLKHFTLPQAVPTLFNFIVY